MICKHSCLMASKTFKIATNSTQKTQITQTKYLPTNTHRRAMIHTILQACSPFTVSCSLLIWHACKNSCLMASKIFKIATNSTQKTLITQGKYFPTKTYRRAMIHTILQARSPFTFALIKAPKIFASFDAKIVTRNYS